jgi:hypothetical protein
MKHKRKERPGLPPAVRETLERLRRFAQEEQARQKVEHGRPETNNKRNVA